MKFVENESRDNLLDLALKLETQFSVFTEDDFT